MSDTESDIDFGEIEATPALKREVMPPTQRTRTLLWRHWTKYAEKYKEKDVFKHHGGVTELQMKGFAMWYGKRNKNKLSPETLAHYMWPLNVEINVQTGQKLDNATLSRVRDYCLLEVTNKCQLKTPLQRKPLATHGDLVILLHFLWVKDKHIYRHERIRTQTSWIIKVLLYTAVRPGAIAVSECYRGSNEAITYNDCDLQLIRDPDNPSGRPLKTLTIQFNYLKGSREDPNAFIKLTLKEDRQTPSDCPILEFLAMTDADKAWKYFESSEDIHRYRLPPGRNDYQVKFKDKMLKIPVLRRVETMSNTISDTEAWTCVMVSVSIGHLSLRAGFREEARPYDFRRGGSNVLQMIATETELCQQMGHKSQRTMQKYISKHVRIDLQGEITKGKSDTRHIEQLRSLNNGMREGAPYKLRQLSQEKQSGVDDSEYLKCVKERNARHRKLNELVKFKVGILDFCSKPALARFMETYGADKPIQEDVLKAIEALHEKAVEVKKLQGKQRALKIDHGRQLWFDEGLEADASYKPSHDVQSDSSPNIESVGERQPITVLLFPSTAPLSESDSILLTKNLKRLCLNDPELVPRGQPRFSKGLLTTQNRYPSLCPSLCSDGDDSLEDWSDEFMETDDYRPVQIAPVIGFVNEGINMARKRKPDGLDENETTCRKPKQICSNEVLCLSDTDVTNEYLLNNALRPSTNILKPLPKKPSRFKPKVPLVRSVKPPLPRRGTSYRDGTIVL